MPVKNHVPLVSRHTLRNSKLRRPTEGTHLISDKEIALFSHFIPCGVREAVYILDGLMKTMSEIQPEVVHSYSHGQSEAVFRLAYLLGIKLMRRTKNWKHLRFYRPDKKARYEHIDELLSDHIDWRLIADNFE